MSGVQRIGELEVKVEPDEVVWSWTGSYRGPALRVCYRVAGERRWSSFLLIPAEGQTIEQLSLSAPAAAEAHRVAVAGRS